MMAWLPFVNANRISIRVTHKCHMTNRRLQGAELEWYAGLPKLGNCRIKIIHFKSDTASILTGIHSLGESDGQCSGSNFVFNPVSPFHLVIHCDFETQDTLVKQTGSLHVTYRITGECDLLNLHVSMLLEMIISGSQRSFASQIARLAFNNPVTIWNV